MFYHSKMYIMSQSLPSYLRIDTLSTSAPTEMTICCHNPNRFTRTFLCPSCSPKQINMRPWKICPREREKQVRICGISTANRDSTSLGFYLTTLVYVFMWEKLEGGEWGKDRDFRSANYNMCARKKFHVLHSLDTAAFAHANKYLYQTCSLFRNQY